MTETIRIQNFLIIQDVELHLNKMNVLIGPQASGKSLIAKLCYFFKNISSHMTRSMVTQKNKHGLDEVVFIDFENRFPRNTWEGTDFCIDYTYCDFSITLLGVKNEGNATKLILNFNKNLINFYDKEKKYYSEVIGIDDNTLNILNEMQDGPLSRYQSYRSIFDVFLQKKNDFFSSELFVPAARSSFANIQKNIFTLIVNDIELDHFITGFGSLYEKIKTKYTQRHEKCDDKQLMHELDQLIQVIVNGQYEHANEKDWIIQQGRKIELCYASSGQQESLPMLLMLLMYPLLYKQKSFFFIEEPEAHLFPTAQSQVMAFLSYLYTKFETGFFLTSHSPYILSSLNNHILADEVVQAGKMKPEKFTELNGYGLPIAYDDVSAYTVLDGGVTSLKNDEYRMIGGDMLDSVSDHFGEVTNQLLALED